MTNPDLAALSAAATQGEWTAESEDGDEWYFGNTDDCMETVVRVGWDALMVAGRANNPDLLLATALVNEYRAGRLVQIDEGMRERVALALCQNALGPKQCACAEKGVFNCADAYPGYQADAAIAAMRGGAK